MEGDFPSVHCFETSSAPLAPRSRRFRFHRFPNPSQHQEEEEEEEEKSNPRSARCLQLLYFLANLK
jgi:hypothetical protein